MAVSIPKVARPERSTSKSYLFLVRSMLRHPFVLGGALAFALGIAVTEVLTVGLLLPFLETLAGPSATPAALNSPIFALLPSFSHLSIEDKIRTIAFLFLAVQVVKALFSFGSARFANRMQINVERDLRHAVFADLIDVDLRYIHGERVANLFTTMHSYPQHAARATEQIMDGIPKMAVGVAYVYVLLQLSWELTLLAGVLALTSVGVTALVTRVIHRIGRDINQARVRLHHVSLETLNAMKVVRLFAREGQATQRFSREVDDLQKGMRHRAGLNAVVGPLFTTMNMALFATLLIVATYVLDKSAGSWVIFLTLFMIVLFRLMGPAANFAKKRARIAADLPSVEVLQDFLSEKKPRLVEGTAEFPGLARSVRFEDVRFRYEAGDDEVLRGVSLEIPKGRTVALVGGSGAGKTTAINLLARLYDPSEGRIVVDGQDLRTFRAASWRRRIAVVSQDTFLFNDTLRENIRYGRLDATDAEVEAAARLANALEFIHAMPENWDTQVGDRGVRLSGGQAQRIAIARAILANPDILILDEATSALDAATEAAVQEAIERVSRDRTVVAIAHRLSTIRRADRIYVLEQGRVVEEGRHDELIARQGHYDRYVRMQNLVDVPAVNPGAG